MKRLALLATWALFACTPGSQPARLFEEHCARCHGVDGRGDPRRRALEPGLDLEQSLLLESKLDGIAYRTIANGSEGMPAFSQTLSVEEIRGLVSYCLDLQERARTGRDQDNAEG